MTQGFQDQFPMLWISDLLTMPNHPLASKAFLFRGIRIKEVTIFGLITNVERMKSAITYNVDDGTGVIICAYDETYVETHHKEETMRLLDFFRDPENTNQGSNAALLWMLERAIDVYDQDYALQEGDSVYVIGVMSQCTEELRVVTVSFICILFIDYDFRLQILL
ncbi:Uncharacterized protein GBIM_13004 [Gryllus bimaculatus]|nr:Uncharacterized protein GBIM_13004 [Gryllus bimaculatus]